MSNNQKSFTQFFATSCLGFNLIHVYVVFDYLGRVSTIAQKILKTREYVGINGIFDQLWRIPRNKAQKPTKNSA